MDPNLAHTLTMHPSPFNPNTNNASSMSRSPHSPMPHVAPLRHARDTAASTAVETIEDVEIDHTTARHPVAAQLDVESQNDTTRYRSSDPYGLSLAFKTDQQLDEIKANTSRKRVGPRVLKLKSRSDEVAEFYRNQNETIERLLKTVEEHRSEARQEASEDHLRHQIAVWGSFLANIILSILQLYAAISSVSLSLFTTAADSVFDPFSNLTLILTHRAVKRVDPNRFPSGKARLENIGNIAFCFLMGAVSLILVAFSIQELATHKSTDPSTNGFHLPSVIAVGIAFATKFSLFLYCWGIKDKYSQVDILWQDHRNDLLINGFGILTSVGGSKLVWWIDPLGSIVLSLIIICIWTHTAFQEFKLLVGVAANVETQQLITYVCLTHSPAILGIDTVRVYHSGPRLIAEVDVVMNPDATLRDTHDVAEELQFKLEDLPDVERAYVHVDYETTHKPEHPFKKDM
ncbi:putative cation diffusion facilitator 1 [Rosellinia necatrix]|uniref:Putative cation diffusion facilitator 1 n=1 Tax=Rosellinia necatrix TaxID=77044 RepID=A0A1W2THJ0_ROSNE|nr:putative cation diffusion facilitator 1 [Rosellinia necatrix]